MSVNRRQVLQGMGALSLCNFNLPNPGNRSTAKDRALIVLWLDGGLTHLDTFDCKPEAPIDIRGDIKGVKTSVDGVFFAEQMPRLGKLMKKLTLFRSITHGEGVHDRASQYLLTGHRPSPVLNHPFLGAVHALGAKDNNMPGLVAIPDAPTHGKQGFLPADKGPFEVGGEPGRPGFAVRNLEPKVSQRRTDLLRKLDALDGKPRSGSEKARDSFLDQARALSLDAEARAVFDLDKEQPVVRQRYGRHKMGQSCLLARRLVENGTKTVLIRDKGWDHHRDVKTSLTYGFPGKFKLLDQSISALVEDLERRELSDKVLFVVASEFGRTPRLNPAGGRDHWPRSQVVLTFGAGMKRGIAIGSTDRRGEAPAEGAMSPADFHATVVAALGNDLEETLHTSDGRPIPVVERGGKPVREALS